MALFLQIRLVRGELDPTSGQLQVESEADSTELDFESLSVAGLVYERLRKILAQALERAENHKKAPNLGGRKPKTPPAPSVDERAKSALDRLQGIRSEREIG